MATKIEAKSDGTPLTDLDNLAAEQFRQVIMKCLPDCKIMGEEDGRSDKEIEEMLANPDQIQCTIDGLDGTWHYAAGTNSFGAQIAFRRGPEILFAMIFRPVDMALHGNGFCIAMPLIGAWEWCECQECRGSACDGCQRGEPGSWTKLSGAPYSDQRLVVHLEGVSKRFWSTQVAKVGAKLTTRPSLSTCIATTTIARGNDGQARAIVTSGHKPWDAWPIACFVKTIGGVVTDHQGNPFRPDHCGNIVAATNPVDHQRVLEILNA